MINRFLIFDKTVAFIDESKLSIFQTMFSKTLLSSLFTSVSRQSLVTVSLSRLVVLVFISLIILLTVQVALKW